MGFSNLLARLFGRATLNTWLQRGYRNQRTGDYATAQKCYRRALAIDPTSVDAHYLLGALLGQCEDCAQALEHLQRAITIKPDFADAHSALGNVWLQYNDKKSAAASYQCALLHNPHNATTHFNLGLLYQSEGETVFALRHLLRAYDLAPGLPGLLKNLTLLYIEREEHETALALLDAVLDRQPACVEALECRGFVLQKLHQSERALEYYERVRACGEGNVELFNNLGIVLQDLGRLDEAIQSYDRALELKSDFVPARWHRSLARLLRHDFKHGWDDYDLRLLSVDRPQHPATYPRWNGDDLSGRGILVYAEQGLGDEIMFASCLPQIIVMSRRCVVECSPKLEKLFRQSFPSAMVYATMPAWDSPQAVQDAGIDLQIAMGSLPQYLRRSLADFPRHQGYLKADPQRIAYWREQLARLGRGRKIGISWQGGTQKTLRSVRSIPLPQWTPILQMPDAQFVSLQYTACAEELAALTVMTGITVTEWRSAIDDYNETAALVSALDLVITVDTSVAHLAGALDTPVWVLAPFSPEWRYGINGEKMPWYPSMRVYRQLSHGVWDPVISRVVQTLRDFL